MTAFQCSEFSWTIRIRVDRKHVHFPLCNSMGKELDCICSLFNVLKGLFNIEHWKVDCPWMSGSAAVLRSVDKIVGSVPLRIWLENDGSKITEDSYPGNVRVLLNIERCQADCFLMGGSAAVLRLVDGTRLVDLNVACFFEVNHFCFVVQWSGLWKQVFSEDA